MFSSNVIVVANLVVIVYPAAILPATDMNAIEVEDKPSTGVGKKKNRIDKVEQQTEAIGTLVYPVCSNCEMTEVVKHDRGGCWRYKVI